MRLLMITLLIFAIIPLALADDTDFNYLKATLMNQDPDPADQGEYMDVRWKIEKYGNSRAEDIVFKLDIDYPFSFDRLENPTKEVGNWVRYSDDEEYFTLHYKLRVGEEAIEGTYEVELMVTAKSGVSSGSLGKFDIRIGDKTESNLMIGTIETDPIKLVADTDEVQLDVQVENIGDGNAENVIATLLLPDGFTPSYSYSERSNLGTIAADGSDSATFYVDIDEDVEGDSHEATLELMFKEADDDDNELKIKKIPLILPLKERPVFAIKESGSDPKNPTPGSMVNIFLTIENIGGKEAESVSVRAFKDSSQPFDFEEKSDFIGTLSPGESGEAVIVLTVDEDAADKRYQLDVEIRSIYEDDVLIDEDTIFLTVDGEEERIGPGAPSPALGVIIILVIATAAIGGFLFGRKKR